MLVWSVLCQLDSYTWQVSPFPEVTEALVPGSVESSQDSVRLFGALIPPSHTLNFRSICLFWTEIRKDNQSMRARSTSQWKVVGNQLLVALLEQEIWTRWSPKVPSNLSRSVKIKILKDFFPGQTFFFYLSAVELHTLSLLPRSCVGWNVTAVWCVTVFV